MTNNLIKGYLPIRISLPSPEIKEKEGLCFENTFIFVKQHTSTNESSPRTLFVTNTPVYPSIQTSILLRNIFERYADVEKILVAPKPQKKLENANDENGDDDNDTSVEDLTLQMFEKEIRSFGAEKANTLDEERWCDQGRYAHVIFRTSKDMKNVLKAFQNKNNSKKKKNVKEQQNTMVRISKLEIQELQDISHKRFISYRKMILEQQHSSWQGTRTNNNQTRDDGSDDDDDEHEEPTETGVLALARNHRDKILTRDTLKNICNNIMEKYEQAETEALRKQQDAMKQPDKDGFITVSYSTNVGDAIQFEQNGKLGSTGGGGGSGAGGGRRKRERTRSAKKNVLKGSDELPDFYRFQLKENKKRSLEELKHRFQEDLKRVKQMKDEKMFRPF